MKVFDNFYTFKEGALFFVPDGENAYAEGKPCFGFGAVRYGEGSVYTGQLYYDGKVFCKLGHGRQDFAYSGIGDLRRSKKLGEYRKAFFVGEYDYRKTDWIYGNGVLYYTDRNNKPKYFTKGFFEGLLKTGEYTGQFDYSSLCEGFDPSMECEINESAEIFEDFLSVYDSVTDGYDMFIGDSYFEMWRYAKYAGASAFYGNFSDKRNLLLGVGGTKFSDWIGYVDKLSVRSPKNIVINLGFNDIHSEQSAETVLERCKLLTEKLKSKFSGAAVYLFNVNKAPLFPRFWAEEEKYNAMLKNAEKDLGITVWDIRSVITQAQKKKNQFCSDEVHFGKIGYKTLTEFVLNKKI